MKSDLRAAIYDLETSLLKPEIRSSVNALDSLLADDFREFSSSGEIYDKKQVLERLPQESKNSPVEFSVYDFKIEELADDIVLATFKVDKTSSNKSRVTSLRTSIWKKFNNHWQMIFHQGTPMNRI